MAGGVQRSAAKQREGGEVGEDDAMGWADASDGRKHQKDWSFEPGVDHEPDDCECGEPCVEDQGTQTPGRSSPCGGRGSEQEERGGKCGAVCESHG